MTYEGPFRLGDTTPDGMQHLLSRAVWDADTVRDDLRDHVVEAGVGACWVAGDEVYGQSPHLRAELQERQVGYVLAVASSHRVTTGAGADRADQVIFDLPERAWQRLTAGPGAKGHRCYDWALVKIDPKQPGRHWLLIRRTRRTSELAFYRCYAPGPVPLPVLVQVAGRRWTIEECFRTGKGLTGLDEHQVRRWRSWYRWTTLAMLAHAFLAAAAVSERAAQPAGPGLTSLTLGEIRHMLVHLINRTPRDVADVLCWSLWRRRHQARPDSRVALNEGYSTSFPKLSPGVSTLSW